MVYITSHEYSVPQRDCLYIRHSTSRCQQMAWLFLSTSLHINVILVPYTCYHYLSQDYDTLWEGSFYTCFFNRQKWSTFSNQCVFFMYFVSSKMTPCITFFETVLPIGTETTFWVLNPNCISCDSYYICKMHALCASWLRYHNK